MKLIESTYDITSGDVPKGDIILTFTTDAQTGKQIYSYIGDFGEDIYSKLDCAHCTLSNLTAPAGVTKTDYKCRTIKNLCYLYVDMHGSHRWDRTSFAVFANTHKIIKLLNTVEDPMFPIQRCVRYIASVDDAFMPNNVCTIKGVEIIPLNVSSTTRSKESHSNNCANLEMLCDASISNEKVKKMFEASGIYI